MSDASLPFVSALYIYPIKGARGTSVTSASVDEAGFVDDRRWMIVTPEGQFITQRQVARLALVVPTLNDESLVLSHALQPELGRVTIPRRAPDRPRRDVVVWRDTVSAEDCGDAAAEWLATALGQPARLVFAGQGYDRKVSSKRIPTSLPPEESRALSFADALPFLVVGQSSLDDLNARLAMKGSPSLPMDRFRPNIVVSDAPAYAEDTWTRWQAGGVEFHGAGPCARCLVTPTDQARGERDGPEPLRLLATYRRDPRDATYVDFGENVIHTAAGGAVAVGDAVTVLEHAELQ